MPARKPTRMKVLAGTLRPDRTNPREPQPPVAEPAPPAWLDRAALALWNELAPQLVELGVLTVTDGGIFAIYMQAMADIARHKRRIAKEGEIMKGAKGGRIKNPRVLLLREAYDRAHRAGVECGLSPLSRGRVNTQPPMPKEDDPWSRT